MKLSSADFFLCRLAYSNPRLLEYLGDVETDFLKSRLGDTAIDRPIFIAGLARSGTTILLNLLSSLACVGTHQYRDFPFLFTPYWWSLLTERLGRSEAAAERPHKDRIRINRQSPEAFEEPIWAHFFPSAHRADAQHVLTPVDNCRKFNSFFSDHVRKILLLRGKSRYVSKGNYNITRIEYLADLFPDAKFVIPIRHPVDHVESLVRQHRLFTGYSSNDPRVSYYLKAAGHYEFGPQRVPISIESGSTGRVLDSWARGDDAIGYAATWTTVYSYLLKLIAESGKLKQRVRFLRYEDLCGAPSAQITEVIRFCELGSEISDSVPHLAEVSAPATFPTADRLTSVGSIWRETSALAEVFGYRRDGMRWQTADLDRSICDRLSIIMAS